MDLRHVLHEQGVLGARRRHREAARGRRLARPDRGDCARRRVLLREALRKRGEPVAGRRVAVQGFGNVGRNLARILADDGATSSSRSPTRGRGPQPGRHRRRRPRSPTRQRHGVARRAARSGIDHERGADRRGVRRPGAVRARARGQRPRTPTGSSAKRDRRGRERPGHPGGRPDPRGPRRPPPPGHPGERGRRGRLVLRVGAGAPGVLLEGGGGEREAERHHDPRVRGDLEHSEERSMPLRQAAYVLAVGRVAEATTIRGLYP